MPDLLPALRAAVAKDIEARRCLPESTYRLQLHAGFTFRDALALVPYLHALGITHCYASPFLQARPGSTHGYDITNHQALNPEIGTEADYEALCQTLQAHGMGQMLDIVPNHMGVTGNANAWWHDVLENGPASPYAGFFDIAWDASTRVELHGKVLLPILGKSYGEALESQEIRLEYAAGTFTVHYFEHCFPVTPHSYVMILEHRRDELATLLGPDAEALAEYDSILTAAQILAVPRATPTRPGWLNASAKKRSSSGVWQRSLRRSRRCRHFIGQNVALFNGTLGEPQSFDLLDALLQEQAYRLCYWRVASEEINYRRFFDINELAALSMEKPEVFAATHDLIFRLLGEGKVHGVRIDHPDGLYDPQQYLQRLQQRYLLARSPSGCWPRTRPRRRSLRQDVEALLGAAIAQPERRPAGKSSRPLYVVVEKILGAGRPCREDWPVYGTSGYDFLNIFNGLFVDADSAGPSDAHSTATGRKTMRPFADVVYDAKRLILQVSLASELHMLAYQLDRLAQKHRRSRDFTLNSLRHALARGHRLLSRLPLLHRSEGIHPDDRLLRRAGGGPGRSAKTRPSAARCSTSCATCCC